MDVVKKAAQRILDRLWSRVPGGKPDDSVRPGDREGRRASAERAGLRRQRRRSAEPRTCILHGGGHKTGTSALQTFLMSNRTALAKRGYYVPPTSGAPAHHLLIRQVAGMPVREGHDGSVQTFLDNVARSKCDNIVLSSELLETLMNHKAGQVFDFLADAGFRVKFIFYVRNTPQLLNSQYSQRVKTYRIDVPFDKFINDRVERGPVRSLTSLLDVLDEKKVDRLIRPYDQHVRKTGIVTDFLNCIGLDEFQAHQSIERRNESLGPVAVEAARRSIREIKGGAENLGHLQAAKCGKLLRASLAEVGFGEPTYNGLSNKLASRIQEVYEPINDQFAERAWGATWADVFSGDIDVNHVSNDFQDRQPTLQELEALYAILETLLPRIKELSVDESLQKKEGFNRPAVEQIADLVKGPGRV